MSVFAKFSRGPEDPLYSNISTTAISVTEIEVSRSSQRGPFFGTRFFLVGCGKWVIRACFLLDQGETWQPIREEVKLAACGRETVCNDFLLCKITTKFEQSDRQNLLGVWISLSPGELTTFLLYSLIILFMCDAYFLRTIANHDPN